MFVRSMVFAAIFALCANVPSYAMNAVTLPPTFIDVNQGYVYFLVRNLGPRTVENLFGWVYGYDSPDKPGVNLLNNPNAKGVKVSLGKHYPGSTALYRFMVPSHRLFYPHYTLMVADESLFHPRMAAR